MRLRQKRARVHGAQAAGSRVTDDDGLDAIDTVDADDFCVGHHRHLTIRGSAEASQAGHRSRIVGTQHDEHALATPHGIHGRGHGGSRVAGHDEVDGRALHRGGSCHRPFHDTDPEPWTIERSG
jgi:hypothetical protein